MGLGIMLYSTDYKREIPEPIIVQVVCPTLEQAQKDLIISTVHDFEYQLFK